MTIPFVLVDGEGRPALFQDLFVRVRKWFLGPGGTGRGEERVHAVSLAIDLPRRLLSTILSLQDLWGIEMKASDLSFRAAVLMVIVGMIWGIVMGISRDHSTMPAQ